MNAEEFLDILRSRRSVRHFLAMPVPDADIEKMITAASWAPSGTNHQNWHFIVVRSPELKQAMADAVQKEVEETAQSITLSSAQRGFMSYANYFKFFHQAPVLICAVKKPYDSVTDRVFRRYGIDSLSKSSTGIQGPSAAIQNLLLMAHALGYGTCWMTGPLIAKDKLENLLKVASPDELMALIPLGRPSHSPVTPPRRKKVREITDYR